MKNTTKYFLILIDNSHVNLKIGGAAKYSMEYTKKVVELYGESVVILCKRAISEKYLMGKNIIPSPATLISRIFFQNFIVPILLYKYKVRYYINFSNHIPIFTSKSIKYFCTIHDFTYLIHKEKYGIIRREFIKLQTKHVLRSSSILIFPSNETKRHYERQCNDWKIKYNPNNYIFTPGIAEGTFVEDRLININSIGFIFVGALEPGKRLDKLLDIWAIYSRKYNNDFLTIVGGIGWGGVRDKLVNRIRNDEFIRNVFIVDYYVSDEELNNVINNHHIIVMVSRIEGFGMPLMEGASKGLLPIYGNGIGCGEYLNFSEGLVQSDENISWVDKFIEIREIVLGKDYRRIQNKLIDNSKDYYWNNVTKNLRKILDDGFINSNN